MTIWTTIIITAIALLLAIANVWIWTIVDQIKEIKEKLWEDKKIKKIKKEDFWKIIDADEIEIEI